MAAQLYKTTTGHMFHAGDIAIVTVGLPARGKTYTAHKLSRYLRWMGIRSMIFSVGDYRRNIAGPKLHEWFNALESAQDRKHYSNLALEDLVKWIKDGGQVGIYDASNTEEERRLEIIERLSRENIHILFIESICDMEEVIQANIRQVKLTSPDYEGISPEEAVSDFLGYKSSYTTITDKSLSFIKMINVGEQIIVNQVKGYLQTRIVYYLMNLHIAPRRIYLIRNGQSLNECISRSDAPLSPMGQEFAIILPSFLEKLRRGQGLSSPLNVWTSPRLRSSNSASGFAQQYTLGSVHVTQKSALVEFNPGAVDGMSEDEIKAAFPSEFVDYKKDPYNYRFPRAESYHDLAIRLESVLLELERQKDDVLIIAHPSVLKCIYAYLLDQPEIDIVDGIEILADELVELIPVAYGCKETRYKITMK